MTPEQRVERYLRRRVKECGGEVRRVKWIGRNGAPDDRVLLPGGGAWVECKREGGKLEAHQAREVARMRAMGEVVYVVDSEQAVDVMLADLGGDR